MSNFESMLFSDSLKMSLNNLANGNYNLVLYNAVGQKIIAKQLSVSSDAQKEVVNLSGITDGIYYLNLSILFSLLALFSMKC